MHRKLNKLEVETGEHWSCLLKPELLAMHSTKKRAHGQTAFRVMWGRQSKHEDLLSVINNFKVDSEEDFTVEQAILDEISQVKSLDDFDQIVDVFSPDYKLPLDVIDDLENCRVAVYETASDSISYEQVKQKIQYDKKVNTKQ